MRVWCWLTLLTVLACAGPRALPPPPPQRAPAESSASPSATTAVDPCPPLASDTVAPKELLPGLIGYPGPRLPFFAVVGDRVLLTSPSLYDVETLLAPLTGGRARVFRSEDRTDLMLYAYGSPGQPWLMRMSRELLPTPCAPGLHAYDPASLEHRWTHAGFTDATMQHGGIVLGDELVLWEERDDLAERVLVALDIRSRQQRWTRTLLYDRRVPLLFRAGGGLVWVEGPRVTAIDAGGRDRFTLTLPRDVGELISASERFAAFSAERDPASTVDRPRRCTSAPRCDFELYVLDLASPRAARRAPAARRMPVRPCPARGFEALVSGADVIAAVSDEAGETSATVLFDAASGRERWRSPPVRCLEGGKSTFAGDDPSLFVCGCDGVLRVHSRGTGTLESEFGVGECGELAVVGGGIVHGSLSVDGQHYRPALQDPSTFALPILQTTVHGSVSFPPELAPQPRRVAVGSTVVTSAKDGTFTATVSGRGLFSVRVLSEPDLPGSFEPLGVLHDGKLHAISLPLP